MLIYRLPLLALVYDVTLFSPTLCHQTVTLPINQTQRLAPYKVKRIVMDSLLVKYQKHIRPYPADEGPTEVTVNLHIWSISKIEESSMDYTIDLILRQTWNDPRLTYNVSGYEDDLQFLRPSHDFVNKIWIPDLVFSTERKGETHQVTVPNRMLRIYPDGDVLYRERYTMTFVCDMDLTRYPFDVQRCVVQLESFSITTESVIFKWNTDEPPISTNEKLRLPKVQLDAWNFLPCQNNQSIGNFSCLRFEFIFTRQLGYHVIESYLPTLLLVFASWLGFWIDANSVPARVSLSVTAMLTMVTQGNNIKHSLPPVSYIKAIDIWLGVCTFYVFAALLEYVVVNYLLWLEGRKRQKEIKEAAAAKAASERYTLDSKDSPLTLGTINNNNNNVNNINNNCVQQRSGKNLEAAAIPVGSNELLKPRYYNMFSRLRYHHSPHKVDIVSRIVFPSTFTVFAAIYVYLFYFVHV